LHPTWDLTFNLLQHFIHSNFVWIYTRTKLRVMALSRRSFLRGQITLRLLLDHIVRDAWKTIPIMIAVVPLHILLHMCHRKIRVSLVLNMVWAAAIGNEIVVHEIFILRISSVFTLIDERIRSSFLRCVKKNVVTCSFLPLLSFRILQITFIRLPSRINN
jgi:hypothetical protein